MSMRPIGVEEYRTTRHQGREALRQAAHVQPGFGVRSESYMHARIDCAANSRRAGAARSGDHDTCLFVWRMIPIGPHPFCGPLSALKPHSHGAASCARLRRPGCDAPVRSRAWRALSRSCPGSIPKARSDLRSGQGPRTPTAVRVLRRGARCGELGAGSSAYLLRNAMRFCSNCTRAQQRKPLETQ